MRILFVIPGDIDLPTGGYRYDRAIIREWQKAGHTVELLSLEGKYPFPSADEKTRAIRALSNLAGHDIAVVDGLAGGVHPELLRTLAAKMPTLALVHHPLCLETGLDEKTANTLETAERQGLQFASGIVCTSPRTVETVRALFGVTDLPVECVVPGTEPSKLAAPTTDEPIRLICVGSVIQRKNHKCLIRALANLQHLDWRLDCIGKTDFEPELFAELEELIAGFGHSNRIRFHGPLDEKELASSYAASHVFVLPSLYEGYGMVYAEAIANGLPVIGTRAGAIPDTVPPGCGILVAPDDQAALEAALTTMIENNRIRDQYRRAAKLAAKEFPSWEKSAARFIKFMDGLL